MIFVRSIGAMQVRLTTPAPAPLTNDTASWPFGIVEMGFIASVPLNCLLL
jgi:hypothetical protein